MFAFSGKRRRFILFLLLFLLALLPRLVAIDRYVTPDELNWVFRSLGLRQALLAGEWGETLRSGHPGVTTTWLGTIAIQLQLWLHPAVAEHLSWLESLYWLAGDSIAAYRQLAIFLTGGRLAVALITSVGVACFYLLGEGLVGEPAALLGALLVALDPFTAGLSGLFHVDALLATFILLTLLLVLHVRRGGARRGLAAAAAGIFTALALLTKTPAVLLLPVVGLMLFPRPLPASRSARQQREDLAEVEQWLPLLVWGVAVGITALLLLPALWSAPRTVLEMMSGLTGRLVEEAVRPTFFLGEMGLDHGPVFYPVALFFRLSPAATLGLLALPLVGLQAWQGARIPGARTSAWLLLFVLLFLILISLVAKKHDRYALPALLTLTLLAGWGAMLLTAAAPQRVRWVIFISLLLLQVAFLLGAIPYPLTAYNWLAGGEPVAYHLLPSGWGEGASAAAQQLPVDRDAAHPPAVFTNSTVATAPFYGGAIYRRQPAYLTLLDVDDYLLVTAGEQQDPAFAEDNVEAALQAQAPAETITLNGREQAWLYTGVSASDLGLPPLTTNVRGYTFDRGPRLVAGGAAFLPWPQETLVALRWEVPAGTSAGEYRLQLEMVDEAGNVRKQQEQPLLNAEGQPPEAWPAGVPQTVYYTQSIPPDLPPGSYRFVVRIFNAQGAQLGVFDQENRFAGTTAPVAEFTATPPTTQPALAIPERYPGEAALAGHGALPANVGSGTALDLDLWWRSDQQGTYLLSLSLGEVATEIAPWSFSTRAWLPEQTYHIKPRWRLPADLPTGRYPLQLMLLDSGGESLWVEPITLGEIQVEEEARNFNLPPNLDPLGVQAGTLATLQTVSVQRESDELQVQTLWQARETTETGYTAFVHLLDEAGHVVAQVDRPPIPPTTSWVPEQVIDESYTLILPAAGSGYRIATGLYDPATGRRLPLYDSEGIRLESDQYLLEVPGR